MTITDESGSKLKGEKGEKKVSSELMRDYSWILIDDVRLPASQGTTQIEHILVSPHAVFLIETNNRTGWIFASPYEDEWIQSYPADWPSRKSGVKSNKYPYKNPLLQNEKHAKALVELEIVDWPRLRPIVVFVKGSEMKTPENFDSFQKHEKTANGDRESRMRGVVCTSLREMHDYINLIKISSDSELTRQEMEGIRDKMKEKDISPRNGI